jgi:hypothetical protein
MTMAEAVSPDIASAIIFGAVRGVGPSWRRECLLTGRRIFGLAAAQMDVSTDDNRSAEDNPGTRTDTINYPRSDTMRMKLSYVTPLLGAAAAGVAIIVAPIASAADTGQSCGASGTGTVCESPGNVQINDSPPAVGFYPYGGDAFLLGGYGGGGFHGGGGGFHGGGGGGHR